VVSKTTNFLDCGSVKMCWVGIFDTHKKDRSTTADMRNFAFTCGSSKHGKTLVCQYIVRTGVCVCSNLSGVSGFQIRRCDPVLGLVGSVARSVEAFKVAFELPSVREDDRDRLRRAKTLTDFELHSLLNLVITEPGLESLGVLGDEEIRHRIDPRSTASAVPRHSTVAADMLINLQCNLMIEVSVSTSQLCEFSLKNICQVLNMLREGVSTLVAESESDS